MSHPREWRCLECRATIGTLRGGLLVLKNGVPIHWLGGSRLRVTCPECGTIRTAVQFEEEEVRR